jgi:hypothetical protein
MTTARPSAATAESLSDAVILSDRRHPDIARALALVFGPEEGKRRLYACRGGYIVLITRPGSEPTVCGALLMQPGATA